MWAQAGGSGDAPCARSSHTLCAIGDALVVFGGEHLPREPVPSSTYCFDTLSKQWKQLETTGQAPVARVGHTATAIGRSIYVVGGRTAVNDSTATNDVHRFRLDQCRWEVLETQGAGA